MKRIRMVTTTYKMNIPVTISLVSDTHNHPMNPVLSSLGKNKPDIICIPGDFVYARIPDAGLKMEHSEHAMDLLGKCSRMAPTFVSLGNHEWLLNQKDKELVRSTGAILLDNEYIHCKKGRQNIYIGGLTSATHLAYQSYVKTLDPDSFDPGIIYPPLRPRDRRLLSFVPDTSWLDGFCSKDGFKILLCHHPEYYPNYLKGRNIDLILSGHAHGGQIRIGNRGLYSPGQGFLPKLTSGVVDGRMVISRGLANNTIVPRWFNPPEIVYM